MVIREYRPEDCEELEELLRLFYDTVHTVNAKDYTKEQLDAWAADSPNREEWNRYLLRHYSLVAEEHGRIIGFGDLRKDGLLHRLFVHRDCQRKGAARAVCGRLEQMFEGEIPTFASITAKPFFEKRGYAVVKEQTVMRNGIPLKNFLMKKTRTTKFI